MLISNRIQAITAEIMHKTIADIGTDHAYIPIWALQSGKAKRAIACDINVHAIAKAERNIIENSLSGLIQTRLGYGLAPLRPGEADTVVMAGLGGMLIIDILRKGGAILESISQLILSPQLDVPQVRRFVHAAGFSIFNETMIYEENQFYHILNCHKGTEAAYNEKEYALGKRLMENRSAVFMQYAQSQASKLEMVARRIAQGNAHSKEAGDRLAEVQALLAVYKKFLNESGEKNESHM